jgi:hypothetical protein
MMENIDITTRSPVDVRRETLAFHEEKLAAAKKQRDVVLIDKRVASARVDKGDQKARAEVARLGKQDLELGRLVVSLERQVRESKKWLSFAEDQAAGAAAWQASADAAAVPADKWFEVATPDGRKVRHRGASFEFLQKALQPGYRIVGQVFGADENGTGGFISQPGFLTAILQAYEGELVEWLASRGIVAADKETVIVLPSNNRELM